MTGRRCVRLVVPADLHLHPAVRPISHAADLLIADWKLRGAWRRVLAQHQAPLVVAVTAGAA